MHRSSPHGPCEPSAGVTGQAWTHAADLPKRDSTLPEAASERDQCSPHHFALSPLLFDLAPALSSPEYNRSPRSRTLGTFHNATSPRTRHSPYHTDCVHHYLASSNRIRLIPSRGAWMTSPLFRSRTISCTGRTYCMPDADPSDKAEDILTQPIPHFTRRIN
jgi:hypothetical protein